MRVRTLASSSLAERMQRVSPRKHNPLSSARVPAWWRLPCMLVAWQELSKLAGTKSSSAPKPSVPTSPALPALKAADSTRSKRPLIRRMPDHIIPPYIEANFRTMTFVLTRPPKLTDFPREL